MGNIATDSDRASFTRNTAWQAAVIETVLYCARPWVLRSVA
jgi:hypothetical protein